MRRWLRRRRDELRCSEVADVLQSHIDGELDAATAQRVSTHLDACLRCGMAASTYRELKSQLARLSDPVDVAAVERMRSFVDELTEHEAGS